jgi:hypothetical protein
MKQSWSTKQKSATFYDFEVKIIKPNENTKEVTLYYLPKLSTHFVAFYCSSDVQHHYQSVTQHFLLTNILGPQTAMTGLIAVPSIISAA